MKVKPLLISCIVGIAAIGGYFLYDYAKPMQTNISSTVRINDTVISVEVVDTPTTRERGLSGREALAQGSGMLFVFDEGGEWGIWMKDMRFAIDIIWADSAGTVVTIAKEISPNTYPQTFYPASPARYVLEVPAGYAAATGLAEGQKIVVQ